MTVVRLALALLLLASGISGCTLTRAQVRQADRIIAATVDRSVTCTGPAHCAVPSPLLEAADQALRDSSPGHPVHVVSLLADGEAALVARLNLIRAAQRTVDVQTYIWDDDDAGLVMLDALVEAARRGVRVRILIDQLGAFSDLNLLDALARASPNLSLKLYNPTFDDAHTSTLQWVAGIACCFFKFNQRMHNKVFVVDDSVGITGGRNYQDRYFDWDPTFDYIDRDVMVGGPTVRRMADSFRLFWNHRRSVSLTRLRDLNRHITAHPQGPGWVTPVYERPRRVERVQLEATDDQWLATHVLAQSLHTGDVEFFSDMPAKTDNPDQTAAVAFTRHVVQMVGGATREVVLQTPYLVISKRAGKIFERLHGNRPPPRIVVSTNSLASTDAFVTYSMSYKHRKRYLARYGFEIYELKPHAPVAVEAYLEANSADAEQRQVGESGAQRKPGRGEPAETGGRGLFGSRGQRHRPVPLLSEGQRFSLHAKSIVVDEAFAMVGSHNFDPRSDHYNTEAGVIVHDQRFARQVRASILRSTTPDNAWVIAPRRASVPVLTNVNQAMAEVSSRLPIFDLWPFRYATSYELNPGCHPLPISDPAFYSCYTAVGDFPDVALSGKWIYTRLFTAFGVGAHSIL
jgi:phosphatidylserine/phosphatidylglycerophosphate/cardiolipin synthase-like enzyme